MTNERAIQILENLISINGDVIIGDEGREALEMAIRSLQQEQPDKGLEEEIETWIPAHISVRTDETLPLNPTELANACKEWGKCIARHFAEWQKSQKTRGTSVVLSSEDFQALIDSHTKRIEADYKEQMLKDAVEGEVYPYHSYNRDATAILIDTPKENLSRRNIGDKVRILVLKAEED